MDRDDFRKLAKDACKNILITILERSILNQ